MLIPEYVLKEIKQVKPCYFKNAFSKFFSWEELERLLNLRPFVNSDRLHIINNLSYSWKNQAWLSDKNSFPPSLLQEELKKYMFYLSDSTRVNREINEIAAQLEKTFLNGKCDAHIYSTIADTLDGGFGIHWDYSHNLIVQIEGATRFQIWANPEPDSSRNLEEHNDEPVIDEILNPGDAVFVPVYVYHRALSQTKRLSVSFPINFDVNNESQDRHWIQI